MLDAITNKAAEIFSRENEEAKQKRIAAIASDLSEAERRSHDLARLGEINAAVAADKTFIEQQAAEVADLIAKVIPFIERIEARARVALISGNDARVLASELGVTTRVTSVHAQGTVRRAVGARFQLENRTDLARRLARFITPNVDPSRTREDD
jgi:hypothetical protein